MFNNGLAGVVATLRQQRVGNAVREGAVRGVVDFDAFSRFNFDQSSSILNACCIYHWVLEDKYETDKIHPSRIISQK
ncbi:hypothetical protein ONQ62_25290, partial [Salmonella enterica subsp. enterica serovar Virginia]|nr:hypothetical protein [Salmonella enterica subsp. enterica serovar Virginia]